MASYVLQHVWYMQNNSVAAPFNMLATNKPCGNIGCFDQDYQSGKITLQVSWISYKFHEEWHRSVVKVPVT